MLHRILVLSFMLPVLLFAEEYGAVVKIFSVSSRPNYYLPWQNFSQRNASASGFVIEGRRIITNAHAVSYPTFITVRKLGDQTQYPARVVSVNHECDLAILTVDAPGFFDGISPMELADLPPLQSSVTVIGYPVGGDNVSITSGVLSRIEPRRYSHSGKQLLAAQVDAAINPGNSGGPAMHGGKVVGIAFQGASSAQNIGYIIPCSVLKHFLEDIADGRLDGFPDVPFRSESLENPDLRRSLKMKEEMSGVLVTELPELLKKEVPLQPGDVVLKVNGRKIANDGTIDLGQGEVLFFGCLFWERQLGTVLPITILRDGAEKSIETKTVKFPFRVPNQLYDRNPSYYLAGGIVFTPLTINYMSTWKNFDQVPDDLAVNLGKSRNLPDEEIVVISMVLADEVNLGYQRVGADIVSTVNGVKITSLRQLAALIDSQKEGFLEIVLQNGMRLVMDIARVREATPRVMHRYRIPNDRSSDLKL